MGILATSCKELTHWKRPWCWEGLGAGGEGDDRGWDGWMASLTQWTWVWVNSRSWWWTGRPGVLRFTGSQRAGHDWATELNWTEYPFISIIAEFWTKILTRLKDTFIYLLCWHYFFPRLNISALALITQNLLIEQLWLQGFWRRTLYITLYLHVYNHM